MQTKQEFRSKLKQQAKEAAPSSYILEDRSSVEALLASPAYKKCTTLFGFAPLGSEVDITSVLEDALRHKRLALPRCIGENLEFVFVKEGWNSAVKPSALGVLEPPGGSVAIADSNTLILVPAMAYTPLGVRLGRGKGFYDRYLSQFPSTPTMGVCRADQLLDYLPAESWDMRVDQVLCCGRIYRT